MSDTFFTAAPEWTWLVVLYFFFGGIAGGSYFIAALIDLFGDEADWPLARLGYLIAFPAVLLCGPLLIIDLKRPERFWHMLLQSERVLPMFKLWSPMSVGSWALALFGLFAFLSFLGAIWRPFAFARRDPLRKLIALVGGALGFFLASYTGVLLSVTNRPIWADTNLLGLLFLASGASTAAALILLLAERRRAVGSGSLHRLSTFDNWAMLVELVALAALVASLGAVARVWLSAWGLALVVGVVLLGILIPLLLHWRPRLLGRASLPAAAVLALIGGFVLRAVVVLSSEAV
ncbi:MAG TPA: NrfD/PsrC family molybdoenzyme membrane anchor subunit [Chloroflexota bacterium]